MLPKAPLLVVMESYKNRNCLSVFILTHRAKLSAVLELTMLRSASLCSLLCHMQCLAACMVFSLYFISGAPNYSQLASGDAVQDEQRWGERLLAVRFSFFFITGSVEDICERR